MTETVCCCHDLGRGHRCIYAWGLLILAQAARLEGNQEDLADARAAYTAHLSAAGLLNYGTSAWPDISVASLADDPRCVYCAPPKEAPHE